MSADILLSLRSLSCLGFSSRLSLVSFPVPASLLSACRLLLELDLSNEGKPKLSTDDFLCAELGVVGGRREDSLTGEVVALPRPCGAGSVVGDVDNGTGLEVARWTLCEEERLKKGIEDGVRRLDW